VTEDRPEPSNDKEESSDAASSPADAISAFETRLREVLGDRAPEISTNVDELQVNVTRDQLVEVCGALKNSEGLDLKYLRCLSVVDWDEDKETEVVYHLASMTHSDKVVVKVRVSSDDLWLPTVIPVWSGADWHEREGHDLFGIEFHGHPNMTPLILYDGFEGFPGRKSYPMPEQVTFYGGD
jgi:NADH-quinone oxidoreductase subunit C